MIINNSTNAESFKRKSNKILGVFTKTKEDLIELNQEQQTYVASVEDKIKSLEEEKNATVSSIAETEVIISKIESFLK